MATNAETSANSRLTLFILSPVLEVGIKKRKKKVKVIPKSVKPKTFYPRDHIILFLGMLGVIFFGKWHSVPNNGINKKIYNI